MGDLHILHLHCNYVKVYNILFRIEPDNEYYDGEKDQDRDGPVADS